MQSKLSYRYLFVTSQQKRSSPSDLLLNSLHPGFLAGQGFAVKGLSF